VNSEQQGGPATGKSKKPKSSRLSKQSKISPSVTLAQYRRKAKQYLERLYSPYFLAVNVLALWEKTLGYQPCEIVKSVFPCGKFQCLVEDTVNSVLYNHYAKVFDKALPKVNCLPSLKDFAKLMKK